MGLLASLKGAQRPVPFSVIRTWFPGAYERVSPAAAERKFERDKKMLLSLGVPLRYVQDEEGESGYIIDESQLNLSKIEFDEAERAAMRSAASSLASNRALPYAQSLNGAFEKLTTVRMSWSSNEAGAEDPKLFEVLQAALKRRARVRLRYQSLKGQGVDPARIVEPYGLFCRRGRWFLVGCCEDRVERFALSRILEGVALEGAPFVVPEGFDVRRLETDVLMTGEEGGPTAALFEVRSHNAFMVDRELPRARRTSDEDSGAWTRFSIEVVGQDEFLDWLIQKGDQARLLSPEPWVDALLKRLDAWRACLESSDGE